jgi:ubiquinone/menaquinone biosynthesis C-methylase UbiE
MGIQQSKKSVSTKHHHYKQKSFASESELNHLMAPEAPVVMMDLDIKYDSMTIDRIHSHHYLLKHVWKGNFSSPIQPSLESGMMDALEIKCGAGTWVLDMATEFPKCSFTGIDVIQIFPSEIKPKNTKFVLTNQPENLPFSPSTFSYVHINFIEHMYNDHFLYQNDIINEVTKIMKCGAWLEITTWSLESENFGTVTQKLISASKYLNILKIFYYTKNLKRSLLFFFSDIMFPKLCTIFRNNFFLIFTLRIKGYKYFDG